MRHELRALRRAPRGLLAQRHRSPREPAAAVRGAACRLLGRLRVVAAAPRRCCDRRSDRRRPGRGRRAPNRPPSLYLVARACAWLGGGLGWRGELTCPLPVQLGGSSSAAVSLVGTNLAAPGSRFGRHIAAGSCVAAPTPPRCGVHPYGVHHSSPPPLSLASARSLRGAAGVRERTGVSLQTLAQRGPHGSTREHVSRGAPPTRVVTGREAFCELLYSNSTNLQTILL